MNNDKINENLMRKSTKERMEKLYGEIKKSGGDIGERVSKSEKYKESDMPNAYHIDNPFGSSRHIDTFESYCLKESKKIEDFDINKKDIKKIKKELDELKDEIKEYKKENGEDDKYNELITKKEFLCNRLDKIEGKIKESRGSINSLEDMYTNPDGRGIDISDDNWIKGTDDDKLRPMFNNHPNIKDRYPIDILRIGKDITIGEQKGKIISIKNRVVEVDIINDKNKHEIKKYDLIKLLKDLKENDNKL